MKNWWEVDEHETLEVGYVLLREAHSLFCDLGIEDDFCVQAVGFNCVIFGGTNRVIWSVRHGFSLDVPYCTEKVIAKWGAMNGQPKYDY